jgi:hypothetical protein
MPPAKTTAGADGSRALRVLRIVVASPGDVDAERRLVVEIAEEINRGLAAEFRCHLEVHRWETDAFPGFHPAGPQGLIDPLLRIENSDLLIGIFWKRFGSPTVDAKSGTEHEIRNAYRAWKENGRPQIMVYFNQKPYSPTSKAELDQWAQVLEFKSQFPKEGLWWLYSGAREFEKQFRNHLIQFLRQRARSLGSFSPEQALQPIKDESTRSQANGYEALTFLNAQVAEIVASILQSNLSRRNDAKGACQALYRLFVGTEALARASRAFVDQLNRHIAEKRLDALVIAHEQLVNRFQDFAETAKALGRKLRVFDQDLSNKISDLLGWKGEQSAFWLHVLRKASNTIATKKRLAKVDKILSCSSHHKISTRFEDPVPKLTVESFSLNDEPAVRAAVANGYRKTEELQSLADSLAQFIKIHCEFVDLFPDDETTFEDF